MAESAHMRKNNKQQSWRNRIVGESEVVPQELMASPWNWRLHPSEQEAALRGVLDEVGWVSRVIVNKRTNRIVDGHLRVATAIKNGEKTVPVVYVDLSEDEEKKILLTLDPLAGMATMDEEKFRALLSEVEFTSEDARKAVEISAQEAGLDLTGTERQSHLSVTADQARLTLCEKFIVPPFSVLDARQGYWQERKRAWIALGIKSELGRGGAAVNQRKEQAGT